MLSLEKLTRRMLEFQLWLRRGWLRRCTLSFSQTSLSGSSVLVSEEEGIYINLIVMISFNDIWNQIPVFVFVSSIPKTSFSEFTFLDIPIRQSIYSLTMWFIVLEFSLISTLIWKNLSHINSYHIFPKSFMFVTDY